MTDLLRRLDESRDFPANTCPASRHAQMIAEALMRGEDYPMLSDEPEHCGESIGATVAALYEARTKLKEAQAENERLRDALRPFVEYVHDDLRAGDGTYTFVHAYSSGGGWIGAEDLRRAYAALNPDKESE